MAIILEGGGWGIFKIFPIPHQHKPKTLSELFTGSVGMDGNDRTANSPVTASVDWHGEGEDPYRQTRIERGS